ncbi:major facilitator superfamily domain-containing protein [Boeremia exigua]|uniref:major facilitator superfamily domain-containing protein n=1 Tax=Boeremia exigua TaxID=749465 RepID=UPI001E8EE7A0|nr:major facilitator superfamily domain-containing protein [Boeremia exigua]KAH6644604.1 major facilitator superfamily domain-containing protein [Boeremia exigua]
MSNQGLAHSSEPTTPRSSKEETETEAWIPTHGSGLVTGETLAPAATNKTIQFTPNDPENPFNWPAAKKYRACILACAMTFIVQINGTMMTSAAEQINESFHVSDEVFPHSYWPVLSWNLGGAAAPLVGLPLMENFGVRYTYLGIYAILIIFIIPQAVAQSFATLIVVRIITGSCTATLANITSGIVSDVWYAGLTKSFFTSMYIFALLSGLSMGPVFGSLVVQYTTWRWIFIGQIIIYSALLPIIFLCLPEVRPDVILHQRASKIRRETGLAVRTAQEKTKTSVSEILTETLIRPTRLLFTEGVLISLGMWSAFVIGIAFMFTQSIMQVYSGLYGWTFFGTGMVQSAIVVGELAGVFAQLMQDRVYFASAKRNTENPGHPLPEARLYLSIPASFIGLTGGLFFFAWTSFSTIPWIVPSIALGFVGFGMFLCTTALTTYIVDAYAKYAASAVAGVAFLENFMAAFLPLATQSMYRSLGFNWASSLLGFIALILSCIPVVLIRYGRKLREKSPFMEVAGHNKD